MDAAICERVSRACAVRFAYNVVCSLGDDRVKYRKVRVRYRTPKIGLPRCPTAGWGYEPIGLFKEVVGIKERHPAPAQLR